MRKIKKFWKDAPATLVCSICEHEAPWEVTVSKKGIKIEQLETNFCPYCGFPMFDTINVIDEAIIENE